MDWQGWMEKTKDLLTPFETENVIKFLQGLTLKSVFGNPYIIGTILVLLFFGIIKRSKFVLLSLFAIIGLLVLVTYTFPPPDQEMTLSTLVPFMVGGLVVGGVIIYFTFIKSD